MLNHTPFKIASTPSALFCNSLLVALFLCLSACADNPAPPKKPEKPQTDISTGSSQSVKYSGNNSASTLQDAQKPNIVWISIEDASANIGAYGDQLAETPNIDALASRGLLYENAYATAPVCAPSRSAIIAGVYATSLGTAHMRGQGTLPDNVQLLPQILQEHGYYTTNNVKEDYNFKTPKNAWNESSESAHWRNNPNPSAPFFAVFNLTTSHESRIWNESRYAENVDLLKNMQGDKLKFTRPEDVSIPPFHPDTPEFRKAWARYYDNMHATDVRVGQIIEELKKADLLDNTIIVFWSDHGAGFVRAKRWPYLSGLHIPLIVSVPDEFKSHFYHEAGERTRELVSLIDLYPTMLDIIGIKAPPFLQGKSFKPKKNEAWSPRQYVFAHRDRMDERYDMIRTVTDEHFHYVRNYQFNKPYLQFMNTAEQGELMKVMRQKFGAKELSPYLMSLLSDLYKPKEELYDIGEDPNQSNNLAFNPDYRDVLLRLRQAHIDWRNETQDLMLIPEALMREIESQEQTSIYEYVRQKPEMTQTLEELYAFHDQILKGPMFQNGEMDTADFPKSISAQYWFLEFAAMQNMADESRQQFLQQIISQAMRSHDIVKQQAIKLSLINGDTRCLPELIGDLSHENVWLRLHAAQILDELNVDTTEYDTQIQAAINLDKQVRNNPNKYLARVLNRHINQRDGTSREVR
uniref:sulfatase family protein n=1 Tax=Ningiella ruwaisensis TaxID=2364274 RepID=UPI00109EE489|nr:sulfatase [Ningiella ruwaisensis]